MVRTGHTVILGWSQQIFTVIEELLVSARRPGRHEIVVLAERDKIEMEDEIRARVPAARPRCVVCRTGSPLEAADLRIAAIDRAQSIVVLSSPSPYADAATIRAILAHHEQPGAAEPTRTTSSPSCGGRRTSPRPRSPGEQTPLVVVVDDLVARIIAQTCRQTGCRPSRSS